VEEGETTKGGGGFDHGGELGGFCAVEQRAEEARHDAGESEAGDGLPRVVGIGEEGIGVTATDGIEGDEFGGLVDGEGAEDGDDGEL